MADRLSQEGAPDDALPAANMPGYAPWIAQKPKIDDVGFGVRDVNFSALAGVPPRELGLVEGNYDPQRTAAALAACRCDQPEKISYHGTTFDQWGADFRGDLQDSLKAPIYDAEGRGGRLSVGKGYALYALWNQGIESLIDAHSGQTTTLGDSPDYQLAARGLNALGAYVGDFSGRDFSVAVVKAHCAGKPGCNQTEIATSKPLLGPFSVAAVGLVQHPANDPEGR